MNIRSTYVWLWHSSAFFVEEINLNHVGIQISTKRIFKRNRQIMRKSPRREERRDEILKKLFKTFRADDAQLVERRICFSFSSAPRFWSRSCSTENDHILWKRHSSLICFHRENIIELSVRSHISFSREEIEALDRRGLVRPRCNPTFIAGPQ